MELPFADTYGSSHNKQVLAIDPTLGAVFTCNRCPSIHLQLGDLLIRTDLAGFQSLLVLLNRAAANFELWAESQRSAA
jgi:hypothetical protein